MLFFFLFVLIVFLLFMWCFSVHPELICAPLFTVLWAAPAITIKRLLSLDIIKAHQNVAGGANPSVTQRPKAGEWSREVNYSIYGELTVDRQLFSV